MPSSLSGPQRSIWARPARRASPLTSSTASLGCQYNTAWFLHHRVMEAMRRGGLDLSAAWAAKARSSKPTKPIIGNDTRSDSVRSSRRPASPFTRKPTARAIGSKRAVISLVERGGECSLIPCPEAHHAESVVKIVQSNISIARARLHTDESKLYQEDWQGIHGARNRQSCQ